MTFGGINYCGTLPAPREGKLKVIEYYVQAVDDAFQAQRTSTFQLSVVPEGKCEFPPIEKDAKRAARRSRCSPRTRSRGHGSTRRSTAPGSPTSPWAASSSQAFLPFALFALANLARAEAPVEVSGALVSTDEDVQVRVDVKNTSDERLAGVRVGGDLLGRHADGTRGRPRTRPRPRAPS